MNPYLSFASEPVVGERVEVTTRRGNTSEGVYLGCALDEEDGVPYHYFADGHINGTAQTSFGFPAEQGTPRTTDLTPTKLIKAWERGALTADPDGEPFHPLATHVDAWNMPVRFSEPEHWGFYATPCCGASAKGTDAGIVCRACYSPISPSYGGVPMEPLTARRTK